MSGAIETPWECPKCGAGYGYLICDCNTEDSEDHGEVFSDPCKNASCYHCGWGGTLPVKPKGLAPWEKKALEAGWVPPLKRQEELKLT